MYSANYRGRPLFETGDTSGLPIIASQSNPSITHTPRKQSLIIGLGLPRRVVIKQIKSDFSMTIKIPTTPEVRRLNAIVEHVDFITNGKLDCFEALDVARWLANHDQPFLAGCLVQAIENAHNPVDNTTQGD